MVLSCPEWKHLSWQLREGLSEEAQVNMTTPLKRITTKGKTLAYASWFSYYAELLEENNIKRFFITQDTFFLSIPSSKLAKRNNVSVLKIQWFYVHSKILVSSYINVTRGDRDACLKRSNSILFKIVSSINMSSDPDSR